MFRTDADANVGNMFSDGDPATGTPGTKVDAAWLNAVQEEICQLLEGLGVTLAKANSAQLLAKVVAAATANTIVRRDANGRAAFATPSAPSDAANKQYVDNQVNQWARAWGSIHLTGGAASLNGQSLNLAAVTPVSRIDANTIRVTFSITMPSANYVVQLGSESGTAGYYGQVVAKTTTTFDVKFYNAAGTLLDISANSFSWLDFVVFGA